MKYIIFIMLFALITISVFAQDNNDEQLERSISKARDNAACGSGFYLPLGGFGLGFALGLLADPINLNPDNYLTASIVTGSVLGLAGLGGAVAWTVLECSGAPWGMLWLLIFEFLDWEGDVYISPVLDNGIGVRVLY